MRKVYQSSVQLSYMSDIVYTAKDQQRLWRAALLWQYRYFFIALVKRDLQLRYKQTVLGVGWALFQPMLQIILFTLLFSRLGTQPNNELPWPVFLAAGIVYWSFFSNAVQQASATFLVNEQLVKKVAFPREVLPLVSVSVAMIDGLAGVLFFVLCCVFFHVPLTLLGGLGLGIGYTLTALTATGAALAVSALTANYRDVRYVLPFFLQIGIFCIPVLFSLSSIEPVLRVILFANPLTNSIEALRAALTGHVEQAALLLASGLITTFLWITGGLWVFRKIDRTIADTL